MVLSCVCAGARVLLVRYRQVHGGKELGLITKPLRTEVVLVVLLY